MSQASLRDLFRPRVADFLENFPDPGSWAPDNLGEVIGSASDGRPIHGRIIGNGTRTFLGWGFPHPDEPVGAKALEVWASWLEENIDLYPDWRFVLIPVVDPVQVGMQRWLDQDRPAIYDYLIGSWRAKRIRYEVDYGFPVDNEYRFHPSEGFPGQLQIWAEDSLERLDQIKIPPPLSESLSLLNLIETFKPELIATLHNMHVSGDYTFLLKEPSSAVEQAMFDLPALSGSWRHLGLAPDPGRTWSGAPDLFCEYDLAYDQARFKKRKDWQPGNVYSGNAGIGLIVEQNWPETQIITPEVGLFANRAVLDLSLADQRLEILIRVREIGAERYCERALSENPETSIFDRERTHLPVSASGWRPEKQLAPVKALELIANRRRQQTQLAASQLWAGISKDSWSWHPFLLDAALGIWQHLPDFEVGDCLSDPVSVAGLEHFHGALAVQTANQLTPFQNFLGYQREIGRDVDLIAERAWSIQDRAIDKLNADSYLSGDRRTLIRSQLARVIFLLEERCDEASR